ncbi:GGDEF domain-containing protein [Pseudomonas mangrovi]|nr:GGDEF domain-containing protein [Pseudomonas mangrovi]
MFERLRSNYQLSVLTLMGLLPILTITPYGIYRLIRGDLTVAVLDAVIVICSLLGVAHAWRTGDTRRPGLIMSLMVSVCAVLVVLNLKTTGLFWIYVVIVFNFFVVSPRWALLLTAATLAAIALLGRGTEVFANDYQLLSFLFTALTASGLVLIFALRARTQQDLLEQQASLDPLTGVGNRRALEIELAIASATQKRHRTRYGVLVLDLDHFKRVNDQHGHAAGDEVLVEFVERVKSSARGEDRLFRTGGEEFLLLLANIDLDGLLSVAGKLLARVGERPFGSVGGVTVSIGGTLLGSPEQWPTQIRHADALLYRAKLAGRDRAMVEEQELARQG